MALFTALRKMMPAIILFFIVSATADAQTITLDAATFYPDSSIVHTGNIVQWTGLLNWQSNAAAAYSLNYTFGDGTSYSVSKITGANAYGADTFRASHAYASAGLYVTKVVLKNALGVAVDSISHSSTAGSGYVVCGKFYYDCTHDCIPDTAELWLGKTWTGIKINQTQRKYLTDSLGFYSVGVATGDTLRRNASVPDPYNTYIGYCANPPVTSTNYAANIAVWISDFITMSDFHADAYACKNSVTYPFVNTYGQNGAKPWVRFTFGNSYVSGFSYVSYGSNGFSYLNSTLGDYLLKVELFNDNFAGPYMRYQRIVHVDSCQVIQLLPYHDINRNCNPDPGEPTPEGSFLSLQSKLLGGQLIGINAGSPTIYNLYPGDTVKVDTVLQVYTPSTNYWDTVRLRQICSGLLITGSSPSLVGLPYTTHIRLSNAAIQQGPICYADTAYFNFAAQLIGYDINTAFRLISYYGDGSSDSSLITTSLDTLTLRTKHVYNTPGIKLCTFILRAPNGDKDTIHYQLTVDNCYAVFVKAFYDKNKNCVQDPGEGFATDFTLALGGGGYAFSDPATGMAKCSLYTPSDSVILVSDAEFTYPPQGNYTRAITAAHGCSWPVMSGAGANQLLALIDTPGFSFSYSSLPVNSCDTTYTSYIVVNVNGNYGHTYTMLHYTGDGITTDTLHIFNPWINNFSLPQHRYHPGVYQPAYLIYDDTTGALLSSYYPSAFTITDTCYDGRGQLFVDADNDCSFSPGDVPLAGQPVSLITNYTITTPLLTNSNGRFFAPLTAGNSYTVKVQDTLNGLRLSCGNTSTMVLLPGTDLAYPYSGNTADVSLLASHYYFKTGQPDTLLLYPGGTTGNTDAGTLSLALPSGISYTGSNISGAVISGQGVSWAIDTLKKLPNIIRIGLALSPTAVAGPLCISASLAGATTDPLPANNDFYLCDSLRGATPSYYKSLCSDSMTSAGLLVAGKELIYSLRLRNDGAAPVNYIVMNDTLDANLDLSTLHILDAGFPQNVALLPGRVLQVVSTGMANLAPGSETAIRFGIKTLPGINGGVIIPNEASAIQNGLPVGNSNLTHAITGMPSTGIRNTGANNEDVKLYPVPITGDFFYISVSRNASPGTARYEVMDARGALCAAGHLSGTLTKAAAHGLIPGIYLVRIITDEGTYTRKMVVNAGRQ